MKRVLLTGATGFIGRYAIGPLVELGYEVHVADITQPVRAMEGLIFHETNLLNRESINTTMAKVRPTHLLNFAWYVEPGKFWTSLENARWVQAAIDLLLSFIHHGGKRVVGAGTCAEYDWTGDGICREASSRIRPVTLYGVAKNSIHQMQDALMQQAGGQSVWGRIFHLYGPHEAASRFVPYVVTALSQGQEARCSPGTQLRDFMHVEDVARAFVHLLEAECSGTVNIGTGEWVTLADIASRIARELNAEPLLRLGAVPQSAGDPDRLVPDVSVLRQLGFRPKWTLDAGLRQTIAWWTEQARALDAGNVRHSV